MAPRGKFKKNKQRNKSSKKDVKHKRNKFNIKQSASTKHSKHAGKSFPSRQKNYDFSSKSEQELKREPEQVKMQYSSSGEEEDHMKQLLGTFNSNLIKRKVTAIESDDSINEEESIAEESEPEVSDNEDIADNSEEEISSDDNVANSRMSKNSAANNELLIEEDEVDVETQNEDDNILENLEDPFAKHLFYDLTGSALMSLQNIPMIVDNYVDDWPVLGKLHIQIPVNKEEVVSPLSNINISEEKHFAPSGSIPLRVSRTTSLDSVYIKSQIINNVERANKYNINTNSKLGLSPLQSEIFSILNNYQDLYFTQQTLENIEEIRFAYCLHIVNHILKTRTKVLHHNARLSKKEDVPEEFRDQGLVRPKILVIVPFRDTAYQIITILINILIPEDKGNVINKTRFIEEFTGHEITMPKKNRKPEDYEQLFKGNTGDEFRIGITVTKKSLKLFADFYSSDIIIASPLGLRTIIGAEGEPERNYDFLASLELLILDQTEIFTMQNWDHLLHIVNHLHLQPKESHGTDFSRVRTWSLNGWAKYYRQTLIFSAIVLPEINAIFNKKCFNYAGRIRTANNIELGSICQVFLQLPHVFHKIPSTEITQSAEDRFNFFLSKILPQQQDALMKQTLIFVSSYFDYVRLRNYFKKEDIGFVQICEYSKDSKIARARDMFFHGDAHFLLYSERYHFFNRVRIKGIRHLIFYQPPIFPHFYYEMCNLMQEANLNKKIGNTSNMTVTVLYSKYDVHQLAGIIGTERAAKMMQSDKNVHMLVTDGK